MLGLGRLVRLLAVVPFENNAQPSPLSRKRTLDHQDARKMGVEMQAEPPPSPPTTGNRARRVPQGSPTPARPPHRPLRLGVRAGRAPRDRDRARGRQHPPSEAQLGRRNNPRLTRLDHPRRSRARLAPRNHDQHHLPPAHPTSTSNLRKAAEPSPLIKRRTAVQQRPTNGLRMWAIRLTPPCADSVMLRLRSSEQRTLRLRVAITRGHCASSTLGFLTRLLLDFLGRLRWPGGFACPRCGGERFCRMSKGRNQRFARCPGGRVLTGSPTRRPPSSTACDGAFRLRRLRGLGNPTAPTLSGSGNPRSPQRTSFRSRVSTISV